MIVRKYLFIMAAIFAACISVAGCVQGPTADQLAAYGEASEKAVSLISIPDELQETLTTEAVTQLNNCRYLRGGGYLLADARDREVHEILLGQRKVKTALVRYTSALKGAISRDGLQKLREATSQLATAAAGTVEAVAGPVPVVKPVLNASLNLLINLGERRRIREAKMIMAEAYNHLIQMEIRFTEDIEKVDLYIAERLRTWERQTRCVLRHVRSERATAARLFTEFDAKKRSYLVSRRLMFKVLSAIRTVKETHLKIIESRGDLDQIIAEVDSMVADFQAVKDAFKI